MAEELYKVEQNEQRVENNKAKAEREYDEAIGAESKTDITSMLEAMSKEPVSAPAKVTGTTTKKPKAPSGGSVESMLSEMAAEPMVTEPQGVIEQGYVNTQPPKTQPAVTPKAESENAAVKDLHETQALYQPEPFWNGGGQDIASGDVVDENGNVVKSGGDYRDTYSTENGTKYVTRQYIQDGIITRQLRGRYDDKGNFEGWLEGSEFDKGKPGLDKENETYYPTLGGGELISKDKETNRIVNSRALAKEIWSKNLSDIDAGDTSKYSKMDKASLIKEWNDLADAYDRGERQPVNYKRGSAIMSELLAREGGYENAAAMNADRGGKAMLQYEQWVRDNYGDKIDHYQEHGADKYANPLRMNMDKFVQALNYSDGMHSVTWLRNKMLESPEILGDYMSWALAYAKKNNISYNDAIRKGVDDFAQFVDDQIMRTFRETYNLDSGWGVFLANMAANNSIGNLVRGIAKTKEWNTYFDRALEEGLDKQPAWAQAAISIGPLIPEMLVMWAGGELVNAGLRGVVGARAAAAAARVGETLTQAERTEAFMRFMATGTGRTISNSLNFAFLNEVGAITADVKNREFNPMGHIAAIGRGVIMGSLMSGSGALMNKILPTKSLAGVIGNKNAIKYFNNTMRFLAEGSTFAGADIMELAINGNPGANGKDKGISGGDIGMAFLNSGAMVLFFRGTHLLHGKNPLLKTSAKGSVAELESRGYVHLAEAIKERDIRINAGKAAEPLSPEARAELEQLNKDMAEKGKGVSWETYSDALRSNGILLAQSTPLSDTQVREVEGGYMVEGLDANGRVIKGKFFTKKEKADKLNRSLRTEIKRAEEIRNEASYVEGREQYGIEAAARRIADQRNEGQQAFLEDGKENPDYVGTTATEVFAEYVIASNTPRDKRTPEQTMLINDFETYRRDALKDNKSNEDIKKQVCEQFGVGTAEFDVALQRDPSERRKDAPVTKAIDTYYNIISKGFKKVNQEPIGVAELSDGRKIDVLNEVEVNEASLPSDIRDNIYYRDADGTVQVVSASKVVGLQYDQAKLAAEKDGQLRDELSERNRERKYNEEVEKNKADYRETLSRQSDEDLTRWREEFAKELEGIKDPEERERTQMSIDLIDEEIERRKGNVSEPQEVPDEVEADVAVKIDPNTGEVIEGEETVVQGEPKQDDVVVKVDNDGNVIEGKEPQEAPKPENEKKPVEVPEAKKDKIDELLDKMGIDGEEDRKEQRAYYEKHQQEFEDRYNEFVGKKEEAVDNSQQESEIVDDLDAPMPTKEVDGKKKADFTKATPRKTRDYIYNKSGLEKEVADKAVQKGVDKAEKELKDLENRYREELEKHNKKEPEIENPDFIEEYKEAHGKWEEEGKALESAMNEERARLESERDYWKEVQRLQRDVDTVAEIESTHSFTGRRELIEKLRKRYKDDAKISEMLNADNYEPKTLYEACVKFLTTKVKLLWDGGKNKHGILQEKGWGEAERKRLIGLIANEQNGGISIDKAVHRIIDLYGQEFNLDYGSDIDVKEALLAALQSMGTKGDAHDMVRGFILSDVKDELVRRGEGDIVSREEQAADARAEAEKRAFIEDHPEYEGASDEEIIKAMQGDVEIPKQEDTVPNEEGVSDETFEQGSDEVPFQKVKNTPRPPRPDEVLLRDGLVQVLRDSGIDVVTDEAAGLRELEAAKRAAEILNEMKKNQSQKSRKLDSYEEEKANITDISDTDGAKVLQKIETLAKKYEKKSNNPRTFLDDLAITIGARKGVTNKINKKTNEVEQPNPKSKYADFITLGGQKVTIRLANHNATAKYFDDNGELEGISIVVSGVKDNGIKDNGNAHIVEFYYSEKDLRRAPGQPLVEIIRSLGQALRSGEYKDTTGLAKPHEVNGAVLKEMRGWHGSANDFNAFDHSHMGEGEGAQAYGYGTYVTQVMGIAKSYANASSRREPATYKGVDRWHLDKLDLPTDRIGDVRTLLARMEDESFRSARNEMLASVLIDIDTVEKNRESYIKKAEEYASQPGGEELAEMFRSRIPEADRELQYLNERAEFLRGLNEKDFVHERGSRIVYEVEIPDNDGTNYLPYNRPLTEGQRAAIGKALEADGFTLTQSVNGLPRYEKDGVDIILNPNASGADVYEEISIAYGALTAATSRDWSHGAPMLASDLLSRAGFVGIEYPAQFRSGGRSDGAKNYVIFNEADAKIVNKTQFFRTENGEVYGFVKDGKIYLDPRVATSETPVHEYSHLWGDALRRANPKAWEHLKGQLLEKKDVLDVVQKLYPDLKGDALMDEVFANFSGKRGAERLREMQEQQLAEAKGAIEKAKVYKVFDAIRNALKDFWNQARDLFAGKNSNLKEMTAEDFADMALNDMLSGFNPESEVKGERESRSEDVRDGESPTFYSNAERAVENIKQNKATAEQWKAMLTKAGGIKAGEDKWMGLSQWLEENKGKSLTKEEVQQFIADNGIEMEEVNYVEHPSQETNETNFFRFTTRLTDELIDLTKTKGLSPEEAFTDLVDKYGTEMLDYVHLEDPGLVRPNKYIDEKDALEYFNQKVNEKEILPIESTRLGYTTEGLDNKREIAFKLPKVESYQEFDDIHFGPENQGKAVMWVRFGETTDADGKRVLVIDEIQSNRHQDAREKGYRRELTQEDIALENNDPAAWTVGRKIANGDLLNRSFFPKSKYSKESAINEYLRRHQFIGDIPAAPFEKNWHEVAMKRMLRLAAEEGFDKVAWTTGEQQAERYHLGNVVDRVISYDYPSGDKPVKKIEVRLKDGETMPIVVDEEGTVVEGRNGIEGKPLSEILGKELSVRIMKGEGRDGTMWDGADRPAKIIEGEGLRIGGEGMKGFYDNMLPRFMDKYGKKWGVKTGEVELPYVEKAGRTMHSVDVTPEMKESVMQGQPLFRQQEPLGERGVKKVTKVREAEYRDGTDYFGNPKRYQTRSAEYKVEGMDDTFHSVEEAADAVRRRNPDYCVYVDNEDNIRLEAWSNLLPEGVKPNSFAKVIAMSGGDMSSAMKKRIAKYTEREMAQARNQAEAITKELGLDVEFHDDPNEFEGRKRKAKGWYDPKTGKIHVVMGNHSGVGDVMATMLHEGVAHHGLRKLFGSDFDTFLDNVHDNVGKEIRAEIDGRIEKMRADAEKNGESHSDDYYRRAATEEYIADLSEDGLYNAEKHSSYAMRAWEYIKKKFLELIRGKGFNMSIGDDELRYTLWKSHQNLRQNAVEMAKDAVLREKAGIKNYVEEGEPVRKVAAEDNRGLPDLNNTERANVIPDSTDKSLIEKIRSNIKYNERAANSAINSYISRHKDVYDRLVKKYTEQYERDMRPLKERWSEELEGNWYDALTKLNEKMFNGPDEELLDRLAQAEGVAANLGPIMAAEGEVRYGEGRGVPDARYRDGEGEPRDFGAELRELMYRRLRGEDVTAELEQLRADREAARRAAESAEVRTENGGAGSGEVPVEPPTPPAPEPAPELPPTGYDRPRTAIEQAQAAAMKAVNDTKASLEQRNAARRELDASLKNIHKAMRIQKEYDRATVENVVSLCKMMVQEGLIDHRYVSSLTPLFTKLKDATGKQDLTSTVNGIMDVMLKSQERSVRNEIAKLLNTKGTKVGQNGVVTQAGLDVRGQRTMESLKENFGKSVEDIDRRIRQLEDLRGRIPENNEGRLNEVDDKIQGALLAKQYAETAKNHEENIVRAEEELAEIKAQYKDGELGLKEYTEQKHALENQIRSYRMAHADAMWQYVNTMRGMVAEGRSRAKDFIEAQKAHKNEIRHNAYSDMLGTSQYTQSRPSKLAKAANSSASQFLSSSLYTLDTMLRMLGRKHANGEGYLYERYGRGWLDARDSEIKDYWADRAVLDEKAQELFGVKHFANLIDTIRKMPRMDVVYKDGGDLVSHDMDQAQLMYIYMVNKMDDGIVKLRRMGISEEDVERIKNFLNPKLVELADWLQNDFLPSRREGYNEVHRRMFGADMDMIENYVPLRIDKGGLTETVDIGSGQNEPSLASTTTGGLIKRTHNTMPLDLMGTNAIDMILGHIDEMNHWKNFAEWNRDVNTLLSDKTFRNKVKNTTTIYGSGEELWKHLKDVFFIAGGTYKPKGDGIDKAMVNIAKGVSAAKVSFRMFTATKQLLSLPVFAANCNVGYMVKNMARPAKSWNWCMENLPSFKQRWKSRIAGDTRLEDTDIDWQYTHKKWVEKASKWGLSPNAFVDAMTVAVGARSVYEQRYKRYREDGYDEAAADRRAKQDATVAFNQSQQSSEKMFVAPMQIDRTVLATGASLFRNASMGYERQFVEGLRNLKHLMGKEKMVDENGNVVTVNYKKASIDFMKKQMIRNGLTETQAENAANRIYNRSKWRNALKVAMFGHVAQFAWNIGGKLPYLAAMGYLATFGNDEDREKAGANALDTAKEAAIHAAVGGWLEGLPFGNVVSDGINNEINGENFFKFSPDLLPFFGDTEDVANHFDSKNKLRGVSDLVNLGAQIFIGVNPQTFLDIMTGVVDATAGKKQSDADFGTAKEALLLTMRIMQCPQSQLDKLMIDELGMSARQAQNLTPEQVARRYAFYKAHHDVPMLWHLYNQEKQDELIKDYEKNFNKKLNKDVKEEGGTPEDYRDLMRSAETKGKHEELQKKYIAALAEKGRLALRDAYEKEEDERVRGAILRKYEELVSGQKKVSDSDEAYEMMHGNDIKKNKEKIAANLGINAGVSFGQLSANVTNGNAGHNKTVAKFKEIGGGGVKCMYKTRGKHARDLSIEEGGWTWPTKDGVKAAKCRQFYKEHKEELERIYRSNWRNNKIKNLLEDVDELVKKAKAENVKVDNAKIEKIYEQVQQLLVEEEKDK